jgi:hypothetical protein
MNQCRAVLETKALRGFWVSEWHEDCRSSDIEQFCMVGYRYSQGELSMPSIGRPQAGDNTKGNLACRLQRVIITRSKPWKVVSRKLNGVNF